MKKLIAKYSIYLPHVALIQAIVATLASLYLSEILHWNPCVLCWYQRILMYPLIIIIAVGIIKKDKFHYNYVLPLSILGGIIALYHYLLQMGILPESVAPCTVSGGVSCVKKVTAWFGFVTIPFLSFVAFNIITACMLVYKRYKK